MVHSYRLLRQGDPCSVSSVKVLPLRRPADPKWPVSCRRRWWWYLHEQSTGQGVYMRVRGCLLLLQGGVRDARRFGRLAIGSEGVHSSVLVREFCRMRQGTKAFLVVSWMKSEDEEETSGSSARGWRPVTS